MINLAKLLNLAGAKKLYDDLRTRLNLKYEKPATGIPASDLADGVIPDISGKADKVSGATSGNFAGLDTNGNLTDSGKKAADFATQSDLNGLYRKPATGIPASDMASAVQTSLGKADTAYQKPSGGIPGTDLAEGVIPDPEGIIDDTAGSGSTNKVWSADKSASEASALNNEIGSKQDAPASGSAAGKVLGLTEVSNELVPTWVNQPSVPVQDVQINGSSILSQGVANVPVATYEKYGVVKPVGSTYGISVQSNGALRFVEPTGSDIKPGTADNRAILPSVQHIATFYGLAKAAGDTTQSASSSPVGQYTQTAEEKILNMIGAEKVITLTGSTPTITAIRNGRYICGEVSTLDFTPCSSGDCEVIFESGSTATVLTVPGTVKFPAWFDATSLEANVTYDIIITNGVYGVVTSWA